MGTPPRLTLSNLVDFTRHWCEILWSICSPLFYVCFVTREERNINQDSSTSFCFIVFCHSKVVKETIDRHRMLEGGLNDMLMGNQSRWEFHLDLPLKFPMSWGSGDMNLYTRCVLRSNIPTFNITI